MQALGGQLNSSVNIGRFTIDEHQSGKLLRLWTPGTYAMDVAVHILHFLASDFEAEIEDTGWRNGFGLEFSIPVLIQLEGLVVELSTDGEKVELIRRSGSEHEFDELCEQIHGQRPP